MDTSESETSTIIVRVVFHYISLFFTQAGCTSSGSGWSLHTRRWARARSTQRWAMDRLYEASTSQRCISPSAAWPAWASETSLPTQTQRRSSPSAPCSSEVCLCMCVCRQVKLQEIYLEMFKDMTSLNYLVRSKTGGCVCVLLIFIREVR